MASCNCSGDSDGSHCRGLVCKGEYSSGKKKASLITLSLSISVYFQQAS